MFGTKSTRTRREVRTEIRIRAGVPVVLTTGKIYDRISFTMPTFLPHTPAGNYDLSIGSSASFTAASSSLYFLIHCSTDLIRNSKLAIRAKIVSTLRHPEALEILNTGSHFYSLTYPPIIIFLFLIKYIRSIK